MSLVSIPPLPPFPPHLAPFFFSIASSPCSSLSLSLSLLDYMIEARGGGGGGGMFAEASGLPRQSKYTGLTYLDPLIKSTSEEEFSTRNSSSSVTSPGYYSDRSSNYPMSFEGMPPSPYASSPWSHTPGTASLVTNPFSKDPSDAAVEISRPNDDLFPPGTGLICSLVREEGHIYSLAAVGDLLYTGSDSKNIRVWKNQQEYSGFKSTSGLVKAIVISGDRIFTGHQDGKIRVWKVSPKNPKVHKRAGTLPRLKDFLKSSMKPSNYVEARRRGGRSAVWIRHSDAVSCLSLNEDQGLLYSGSWDRTFKVWRISDSKCLESVSAHEDAVNAVVAGLDGLVFTGSADGTVKVWRRELGAKGGTRHAAVQTLLRQECAVTSLVVSASAGVVYCGSSDGVVNFWEREQGMAHGGALKGHKMAVLCLAAAGSLLFSGSADKAICVWRRDAGAHTCLSVLTGHAGPVKCLAVEAEASSEEAGRPPGKAAMWVVYSGSLDKSVKVWKVAEQPPLHQLQKGMDVYENEGPPQYDMY